MHSGPKELVYSLVCSGHNGWAHGCHSAVGEGQQSCHFTESIPATPGHHVIKDQGTEDVELPVKNCSLDRHVQNSSGEPGL